MSTTNVGFIGLGNIGKPIAQNLVTKGPDKGMTAWVYDVLAEPIEEMVALGATGADSPAAIAKACEIIGLCVRHDGDVESLLYGDEGLLENMAADSVIAIHSTVKHANLLRWAEEGKAKGIHIFDVPVSGRDGANSAAEGDLVYMVGGDEALLERCRPMFETAASLIIHAGPVGTGIVYKTANNLVTWSSYVIASEAVKLLDAHGLDPAVWYNDIVEKNASLAVPVRKFIGGREMAASLNDENLNKYMAGMGDLGEKDVDLALTLARDKNTELPLTSEAIKHITDAFLKQGQQRFE
jgi:3-hydroxyisobutyrate dehydrogenase-like beta-hydroxyacid dehydrogenase